MRLIVRLLVVGLVCAISAGSVCFAAEDAVSRYNYMKRFSKAFDLVRNSYVREVTNDDLMNGAIRGMLQSLDPHSTFLDKKDFEKMQETTTGEFFGIGIEMTSENNQLMVVSPIEDTPAHKAGLRSGDLILAIDGQPSSDMSTQEAASKIRGPKDTEVELLILHKEANAPETVRLKRDAIPLVSVKSRFLDDNGIAWVRVTRFTEKTTTELHDAIEDLKKKGEVKGIVLDLRNNPGGLLKQSVTVANAFLDKGAIVSIRGRGSHILESHSADPKKAVVQAPMVVLINPGTASASEIVAGALQDNKRALVVGERSFGKGSVQNIHPLEDGTAVKLTIALYYTPNGRSIQAEGITPDIEIPFEAPSTEEKKPSFEIPREKDLSGHIELTGKESGKEPGKEEDKDDKKAQKKLVEKETQGMLDRDNQLRMALQLARGLPRITKIQVR
jgi:C-terminal peptidase (prc)